jgi:hypothetical protein
MTPLATLKRDFFVDTDWVRYEPGLEGQRVDPAGVIYLGDRAGPSRDFTNVAHELSHFVEIEDRRLQISGWGLRVPTVEIWGTVCTEPRTHQMTDRELRVQAYQANLLEALGVRPDVPDMVRCLQYMPDFHMIPLEDGRMAYAEGSPKLPLSKVDRSRFRWMANTVKELRKHFTFERFRSEWARKIALLEQKPKFTPSAPVGLP